MSLQCPAAVVGRQAQPWESLGTSRQLKAHDDCRASETGPAARDRQSWHASMLPVRAPPCVLSLGTGSCTLRANLPVPQSCKGEAGFQGLAPRARCSAAHHSSLKARQTVPGGVHRAGVLPSGASSRAEALQRHRVAGGSLQHLRWLWVPVAVPTLGRGSGLARSRLYGDNPTPTKAAPKAWSTTGLFSPLFPTKNWGQQTGEPGALHRVSAPVPSWVHQAEGGAGAGCRGSHQRCAICFSSGCWECRGCRGPAAGHSCDRWSVYHVSALLRMLAFSCERRYLGSAAPSVLSLSPPSPRILTLGTRWAAACPDPRVRIGGASLSQPLVLAHGKGWAQPCHPGNGSGLCLSSRSGG
ncbi:uncharacterized protein LOC142603842 [Balearica regulorum gibbericeps]|uniref:uncharacterized protein LOC142603842 n=1 Tax=Balearica regulorum gibbericeps TaxID=100784 RepID=UPI003F640553